MLFEEFDLLSEGGEIPAEDMAQSLTPEKMLDLAEEIKADFMDNIEDPVSYFRDAGYQEVELDIDGDGIVDRLLGLDQDGDGVFDKVFALEDPNFDGIVDAVHMMTQIDADHDGIMDGYAFADVDFHQDVDSVISVMADLDGDGIFEAEGTYLFDGDDVFMQDGDHFTRLALAYKSFDPAAADDSSIVGNPADCLDNWHRQETDFSCAIVAQMAEIEEQLNIDLNEADLREIAIEKGWASEGVGTTPDDTGKLMEYMGISVERSYGNGLEDIRACLERGSHPIVGVDADELWNGYNEELVVPGRDANHAIQVIGIDESDPDNPMVIINDSGVPNGCGAMVPADMFLNAWDSDGFMVAAL